MSKNFKNNDGIKAFSKMINDFKSLDNREIRKAIVSKKIVVSKTEEEAKDRKEYEDFMRQSNMQQESLIKYSSFFIDDIFRKHLG